VTEVKHQPLWRRALFVLGVIVVIVLALLGGIGVALGMVNMGG
jgi:hypothetical protein